MNDSEPLLRKRMGRTYQEWPSGFVYFATIEGVPDLVKIGWSQNPWYRVKSCGGINGRGPDVRFTVEVHRGSPLWGVRAGGLEFQTHRRLARNRVDRFTMQFSDVGEWYRLTEGELAEVVRWAQACVMATGASAGPIASSVSNERSA